MFFLLACFAVPDEAPSAPEPSDTGATDTDTDTGSGSDTDPVTETDPPDTGVEDTAGADTDSGPTDTGEPEDTGEPPPDATWCYTLVPDEADVMLVLVDMATGSWTVEDRWSGLYSGFHTGGLATDGATWVFPGYNGNDFTWYAVDVASGALTTGRNAEYAVSVAWSGTDWVALDSYDGTLERFATFADLNANTPSTSISARGFTRLAVDGGEVYGAWHSTNTVEVYDLTTGGYGGSIALDDWDTWVWGMSVAGGQLHLIDDGRQYPDQRIVAFDPSTGAMVQRVFLTGLPGRASGLHCVSAFPS